jgi:3-hydroxybutyrate dehydrogenase
MKSLEVMSDSSQASAAEELARITSRQAIDGLLEPQDVVSPYLFLASDAAADITGQALNVDRGEVMY